MNSGAQGAAPGQDGVDVQPAGGGGALGDGSGGLLSITIDPEHDTPEILRAYGESLGADFETWTFATAAPEVIDGVTSGFRLFRERNGVQLDHALIAPDGTVIEIWRGNGWTTDTVYERTSEAIENEVSASAT